MPRLTSSVPKYRLHRASGQAVVTISGHDVYLGPWRSKASRLEYDRLVAEWLANDRRPVVPQDGLTVVELLAAFWRFAKSYYVKNGRPTGELENYRYALRPLKNLYGSTLVEEFGPKRLKTLRARLLDRDLSRGVINARVQKIKRVFRWGAAEELVPTEVYQALAALEGLKKDRTKARETLPVRPVADEVVEATLPHMPPVVASMVRFQRLTGCRPAEARLLQPCLIDRSEPVWVYRPRHKLEHLDIERFVFIGPKAQELLKPYLNRPAEAFCFSPAESESSRKAAMRARRKTKVQPSQLDRRKRKPIRRPKDHYDASSYRTAVHRACDKTFGEAIGPIAWNDLQKLVLKKRLSPCDMIRKGERNRWKRAGSERGLFSRGLSGIASPVTEESWFYKLATPRWSPGQLRHSAGTEIRKKYGLEGAQVVLGHRKADTTQIYAERDLAKAAAIIREVG